MYELMCVLYYEPPGTIDMDTILVGVFTIDYINFWLRVSFVGSSQLAVVSFLF